MWSCGHVALWGFCGRWWVDALRLIARLEGFGGGTGAHGYSATGPQRYRGAATLNGVFDVVMWACSAVGLLREVVGGCAAAHRSAGGVWGRHRGTWLQRYRATALQGSGDPERCL